MMGCREMTRQRLKSGNSIKEIKQYWLCRCKYRTSHLEPRSRTNIRQNPSKSTSRNTPYVYARIRSISAAVAVSTAATT